jgi:predicted  nucleic acid-binding Zn-ribbon protein
MSVESYKRLKDKVKDLCILIHTGGSLAEDSDTQESLDGLLIMSPEDMVDYAKLLIVTLFKSKDEEHPDNTSFKAYQKALQKLEAEVRNHITVRTRQIEEQLKLYLDHIEAKHEKSERQRDKLQKEAEDRILALEKELAELRTQLETASKRPEVKSEEAECLRQSLENAKDYVKELEQRCSRLETKVGRSRMSSDYEVVHESADTRKRSELVGLVKKLNSLKGIRSKAAAASVYYDAQTSQEGVPAAYKATVRTHKAVYSQDIHVPISSGKQGPIGRSKSTERLGRANRSASRSKVNLSSTIRNK